MAELKHTPGPWAYRKHDLSVYAVPPRSNRAVPQIKKLIGRVNQTDDWHANARLIVAAPVLLEALQLVRMSMGWQYMSPETRDIIDAAISLATGGDAE